MPISPTQLVREAEGQKLDPVAYAEKRFEFGKKEAEIAQKAKQTEIAAAVKRPLTRVRASYRRGLAAIPTYGLRNRRGMPM